MNVKFTLNKGSFVEICLKIHDVCDSNDIIHFMVIWIPRSENIEADYRSRCFDSDEWPVNKDIFRYFDANGGYLLLTGFLHIITTIVKDLIQDGGFQVQKL